MGYATVMRVPRIRTYAEALRKFTNTKPIRGRDGDPVPLGERRHVDTYSIRKNVWTDTIELVLYRTPVIKFKTDDEVVVGFGQWSSASTCQFISRVLGVPTNRVKGQVVMHLHDDTKAMIADHEEITLIRNSNGAWMPKVKQTLYDYRVDRKGANNVRKQVSEFRKYLNGVIKLKAEEVEGMWGREPFTVVRATYGELIEVFGNQDKDKDEDPRIRPDAEKWTRLTDKPKNHLAERKAELWADYREKTNEFFDLIKNDQCDNTRHQNYWIAFNILMVQGQSLYWRTDARYSLTLGVQSFDKFLDAILMKMFADKVFKRVALPEGKVPTQKYADYVRNEEE